MFRLEGAPAWENGHFMSWVRRPFLYALLAVLLASSWQALTVRFSYAGNWTALFCTGSLFSSPPVELASENIHRFANSNGYDGQIYHYIAHDPLLRRGFQSVIDSPRFRYRRILVPLSAWLLAGGQDRFVDRAYRGVVWGWVFLGTLWTGLVISDRGGCPAWSLAFLFVPAVTVSLDRLTVDATLVAVTAGIVWCAGRGNWWATSALCALACLTRESGLLIPAALVVWCALRRHWVRAAAAALSTAPAAVWYLYVQMHANAGGEPVALASAIPFVGIVKRLVTPVTYPFGPAINALATALDYAALAGIISAVVYCGVHWRRLIRQPDGAIAFAFVALAAAISTQAVWEDAYAFARGFSPLILIVGLDGFRSRLPAAGLPLALTAPRIGLQIGPQIFNVTRGLFGR